MSSRTRRINWSLAFLHCQLGLATIPPMPLKSDAKRLTDAQRQELCRMIHHAFVEIRLLCSQGKVEQAADLADAFHHIPIDMWDNFCSLQTVRDDFLVEYQKQYSASDHPHDYVAMVNEIVAMEG